MGSRRMVGAGLMRRFQPFGTGDGSGGLSPTLVAGLLEWWRGDSYTAGSWASKRTSGGHTLTQGTGALQPVAVTRASLPALQFDGADLLVGSLGATIAQPVTYYFILEPTSLAGTSVWLDGDDATNRQFIGTNVTPNYLRDSGSTRNAGTPTTAIHGVCVIFNGASGALYVDNMRTASVVDTGDTGANSIDAVSVGANFLGSNGFVGFMWEVLIYQGAHTAAQRAQVAAYLKARNPTAPLVF